MHFYVHKAKLIQFDIDLLMKQYNSNDRINENKENLPYWVYYLSIKLYIFVKRMGVFQCILISKRLDGVMGKMLH